MPEFTLKTRSGGAVMKYPPLFQVTYLNHAGETCETATDDLAALKASCKTIQKQQRIPRPDGIEGVPVYARTADGQDILLGELTSPYFVKVCVGSSNRDVDCLLPEPLAIPTELVDTYLRPTLIMIPVGQPVPPEPETRRLLAETLDLIRTHMADLKSDLYRQAVRNREHILTSYQHFQDREKVLPQHLAAEAETFKKTK